MVQDQRAGQISIQYKEQRIAQPIIREDNRHLLKNWFIFNLEEKNEFI